MARKGKDELRRRATKAIISHAFFRLESAVTICLTILLIYFRPSPFAWWRWWYWLLLGSIFEGLIFYTSLIDERTGQKVVEEMLRQRYDPGDIKTRKYRNQVEQALAYREQIQAEVARTSGGLLRDHLYDSTAGIADWIGHIFAIAQRLDTYARDELIHRDMREVPSSVGRLRNALAEEDDLAVRKQIEVTLAAKGAQWENLRSLQNKMEEAEFRLEETVTSLATVYSQFQLIGARKLESSRARHLSDNIRDQVQRLQDILDSMDQVYEH